MDIMILFPHGTFLPIRVLENTNSELSLGLSKKSPNRKSDPRNEKYPQGAM